MTGLEGGQEDAFFYFGLSILGTCVYFLDIASHSFLCIRSKSQIKEHFNPIYKTKGTICLCLEKRSFIRGSIRMKMKISHALHETGFALAAELEPSRNMIFP